MITMRNVGPESRSTYVQKVESGFFARYMSGTGLDVGPKGSDPTSLPILETAIGVDLDFPGYDGLKLPFPDESQDYVYSSHMLEHVADRQAVLRDWYRVTKVGGHVVIIVPHQFLYEKRRELPSVFNGDHKVFYTPAKLLAEVELALEPNSYRVRLLQDEDDNFDYSRGPELHSAGTYQICLVLQKIKNPEWNLA